MLVNHQLGRDGTRSPLKTAESQRALDIPPKLMRRLVALVTQRGDRFNPNAFVFASATAPASNERPLALHSTEHSKLPTSPRQIQPCTTSATATPTG